MCSSSNPGSTSMMFHALCVCLLDITMSCAEVTELIEMPFGLWPRVDPRNHVLGGGLGPPGQGAILGHLPRFGFLSKFFDYLWNVVNGDAEVIVSCAGQVVHAG